MATQINLDSLKPWEAFYIGNTRYTVILLPLCRTRTILCRNEKRQEMEDLAGKTKVRRA